MGMGNAESGEWACGEAGEPVEEISALRKDGGGVRICEPRGGVGFVGEVPVEESLCTTARVSCFEENVMEDVGDGEGLVGACYPRLEAGV